MTSGKKESKEQRMVIDDSVQDALVASNVMMDATTSCPVCKNDTFINPSLKLLVSPCYHRVCDSCVERLFAHGSSPCPVCGTILRRNNFVTPNFEDMKVEKECRIRKRIGTIFNKCEDDFETLRDFNDYLEKVEVIIFELVNDVDVQKINATLEAYREQNLEQIARNKAKREAEDEELLRMQYEEEQKRTDYESQLIAELEAKDQQRIIDESKFIEELAKSASFTAATTTVARKRAVANETRKKAQESILSEMPSFKGLKSKVSDRKLPPFDPFDTVPELILPMEIVYRQSTIKSWFFAHSKLPNQKELMAGGVKFENICKPLNYALCFH